MSIESFVAAAEARQAEALHADTSMHPDPQTVALRDLRMGIVGAFGEAFAAECTFVYDHQAVAVVTYHGRRFAILRGVMMVGDTTVHGWEVRPYLWATGRQTVGYAEVDAALLTIKALSEEATPLATPATTLFPDEFAWVTTGMV